MPRPLRHCETLGTLDRSIEKATHHSHFIPSHHIEHHPSPALPLFVQIFNMVSSDVAHCKNEESDEALDYKGKPIDKSKTGGWLAAGLILGAELAERICVQGISLNLVTYLVGDLHISNSKSSTIVSNFLGSLNLLALFGGFLADAKLGRYLTVAIFSSVTALGVIMFTISTAIPSMKPPPCKDFRRSHNECIEANGGQLTMLYVALYMIALGGGGLKSSVSGFGSDQFDIMDPKEEKAMIFFFNRFYFCISLGSLFGVTVLVYIQDNVARAWGYGISAGAMTLAVIILLVGTKIYRYKKPKEAPSLFLDKAAVTEGIEANNSNQWIVSTVTQVEEVKMVFKLIPIWSTCILFWTVYSQMTTFSVEQATIMNRKIGSFVFPAGSLPVFLIVTILIFTSLNEKLLVPLSRKFTHNPNGITSLQRIAIGLIFAIFAMVVAAIVEKHRRISSLKHKNMESVFWLVPQYFIVGAGEAFSYVGQLEFFIREAPERMKSMSTGLFLSTLAMGFFLSSLLVTIVDKVTHHGWIRNNLNNGRLDYFYWLLAVLGVFNFLAFLWFASKHQYKVEQLNGFGSSNAKESELKGWNDGGLEEIEKKEGLDV
ncbi:hypothetical protein Sjap_003033 [Stephania japonica]|uniref:Uncharacterized protein n=1 Tax=Stephania japonica TaxID=461633 RepID=A0AAP0KPH9_9MAGN